MRRRWIGYAAWLGLAACLYFFENNTGTRIILACSALFPLIPALRSALLSADRKAESCRPEHPEALTVRAFRTAEGEEPGDVRVYLPGDPVRRIHWKLSAKKGSLLVRDTTAVTDSVPEERTAPEEDRRKPNVRTIARTALAAGMLACLTMLLLIPEANRGVQALCNRLFAASEAANAYAYRYFTVPENQDIIPAVLLISGAALCLAALTAVSRSRLLCLGLMAACTLFQVYFGLAFPAWANIALYSLLALGTLKRLISRKALRAGGIMILLVSLAVMLMLPGTDYRTEAASESVRDILGQAGGQITGTIPEEPDGETETRHLHMLSEEQGDNPARTGQEYRPVTEEEEQVSLPHWINWIRMILLLLLSAAVIILPFTPFMWMNARRKKAREARAALSSGSAGEAVQEAFRRVIGWLEATGNGGGNRLYREWGSRLPGCLPEGYADRFARCAEDFEEAVYSGHELKEEQRGRAMDLLKETETALWNQADRRQRFRLRYRMCLYE